uniref:Uncharacterized protein AlNc14C195G8554 n=1 Tax=Albugo laibachii Nc14 TaxID=890382 RepID=F0WQ73_9STRA|nr:conserved hypothetical protein [Albugo laibachii Nc14]CCA26695.1 conserved hypothetical protein [Albugo laibachii Nc14]|eukprot:CCA26695.1 conserved hypothetical protein [Albugo laibachii Nc14]
MFATRTKKSKSQKRKSDKESENSDAKLVLELVEPISKRNKTDRVANNRNKNDLGREAMIDSERQVVPHVYAGDATYETQIDTEKDRDARAVLEKNILLNKSGSIDDTSGKLYKGQAAYKNYIAKSESQIGMNKYTGTQGPIRAQTWARSICRFDYQPDVCKDYKETGFCGFGDTCKFLHDRGDYKGGWQIEKEYKEKQMAQRQRTLQGKTLDEVDENEYLVSDDADEQFACTICRQPFQDAVKTICGHIFCEKCALKHFRKTSRCFNCGKQTNGAFNVAWEIRKKEDKKKNSAEDST